MTTQPKRDRNGRFEAGGPSHNPNGRPLKQTSVDAAVLGALADKVQVTEQGRRKRRSKLEITAAQIANQSASGNLRAAKLALAEARKAEERAAQQSTAAPVMTETDHEIAARVVARLTALIRKEQSDDLPEA